MCTICGCSDHSHDHQHEKHLEPADARLIEVEQNILGKNNRYAELNRQVFAEQQVAAFNLVSSPGSGKTSLLCKTIEALKTQHNIAVIEGDQQTDNDAKRIRESGAKAVQINTGKGCHLDAHAVGHALDEFDLARSDFLFIENVGNLVCPAAFDLGEQAKVVVLSVTEGDDKPLKYPDMFHASSLMLINKTDLLPYVDFDTDKTIEYARRINPDIEAILISAKTGEGFDAWLDWLKQALT
jgi:hydrogenase nickel incorporation protein HypB